jgi:hypothetical protein
MYELRLPIQFCILLLLIHTIITASIKNLHYGFCAAIYTEKHLLNGIRPIPFMPPQSVVLIMPRPKMSCLALHPTSLWRNLSVPNEFVATQCFSATPILLSRASTVIGWIASAHTFDNFLILYFNLQINIYIYTQYIFTLSRYI